MRRAPTPHAVNHAVDHAVSLETLHARFHEFAVNRAQGGAWAAHEAVLDRLASNRQAAEAQGWTSCALERLGGMGQLDAWGIPPGEVERHPIPDRVRPS